tara:strand:- start:43 stop:702 length:660 start_codon:yes stop_codon:yes gene_type:complete
MKYPRHEIYEILYARFFREEKTEQMLDAAGDLNGKVILDCCCGNGRLTTAALKRGAEKSFMIDKEIDMVPRDFWGNNKAKTMIGNMEEKLELCVNDEIKVDAAFCQQSINYWLNEATAMLLSFVLKEDGVFVFNTFKNRPPIKPLIKEYCLEGKDFIEVTWSVGKDDIHHLQICSHHSHHFTKFKWMDEDYIRQCLTKRFWIHKEAEDDVTVLYKCVRR